MPRSVEEGGRIRPEAKGVTIFMAKDFSMRIKCTGHSLWREIAVINISSEGNKYVEHITSSEGSNGTR